VLYAQTQAFTMAGIKFNYQLHFTEYQFLLETIELIFRLLKFSYWWISCKRDKNSFL